MKLNEEQLKNIDIIKQAYEKLNAPDDTPRLTVLLSTAMIESSLKSNQKNYQCKYCGIYQLSEGYNNECEKTEDRFDIEKSTNCTYNIMLQNKKRWEKEKISKWKDYMYYLMHQQGFSGFKYIYNNRNKKIKNMRDDIIKNITGNIPLKDGKKVITENNVGQDFINIWKKRFEELTKEFQTIVGEKKDIKANEKNKLKVFYTGIGLTALGGLTYYFIIQDKKKQLFLKDTHKFMKSRKKSCLSDYYVVTKVFKNYKEFEIEKENGYKGNGISQKILDTFYSGSLEKAKKDNERNLGCWNCTNCTECYNCIECHMCSFCQWCNCCNLCLKCSMCSGKAKKITFHQNKNIYKTPASEIEKAIEYNCNNVRDY